MNQLQKIEKSITKLYKEMRINIDGYIIPNMIASNGIDAHLFMKGIGYDTEDLLNEALTKFIKNIKQKTDRGISLNIIDSDQFVFKSISTICEQLINNIVKKSKREYRTKKTLKERQVLSVEQDHSQFDLEQKLNSLSDYERTLARGNSTYKQIHKTYGVYFDKIKIDERIVMEKLNEDAD